MSKLKGKKEASSSKVSIADRKTKNGGSAVASSVTSSSGTWSSLFLLWPKWNEIEINKENWESSKTDDGKPAKGSNTNMNPFFEDPEGKVILPTVLKVHSWKRPKEFIITDNSKTPTVVENHSTFDLVSSNEHLMCSELMRRILSEIYIFWTHCHSTSPEQREWKPWEHIYSLCKVVKGHVPLFNEYGKYVVKLFWMGCWRRLTVDDSMPFDESNKLLLPASTCPSELWPMLLAKALIKLANTNPLSETGGEIGEFTFIPAFTGWVPEIHPLISTDLQKMWAFLRSSILTYRYPDESSVESRPVTEASSVVDEANNPTQDHTVLLTRTRDCSLEPPPKPVVPRWKLIRPRKEIVISDEPQKLALSKPELFIEVSSVFLQLHIKSSTQPEMQRRQGQNALVSIAESEESGCSNGNEPDAPQHATNSPNNTHKTEVTAVYRKKEEDDTSSGTKDLQQNLLGPSESALNLAWVELEDFPSCFQNLITFHNPQKYPHKFSKSHFKASVVPKSSSSDELWEIAAAESEDVSGRLYLCVDSLQTSQIFITLSALLRFSNSTESVKDQPLTSAVLMVQPYSWKSLQCQLPLVTIHTSYSETAKLILPPGRHVLCIRTSSALGYNIQLFSETPFVIGDENAIMSEVTKKSLHFTSLASSILTALSKAIATFCDVEEGLSAKRVLLETYCPQHINKFQKFQLYKLFNSAVEHMFSEALERKLTPDEQRALQALTTDPSLEVNKPSSEISTIPGNKTDSETTDQEENPVNNMQPGIDEDLSIQIFEAAQPGTRENAEASQILFDMWLRIESDLEKHAASLLSYILENSGKEAELYPCEKDDWANVAFDDYSSSIQNSRSSWFVVFREVLFVSEDILVVPKVTLQISTCVLHVINNDSGEEVGNICNKVVPYVYRPNQLGYTFLAEAVSAEADSTWSMRLIGSNSSLPKPVNEKSVNKFAQKDFTEYYVPNRHNVICRYVVEVSSDVLCTIQFETSKADVMIRLSVLDQGKEVSSRTGTGHVLIPVFFFLANVEDKTQNKPCGPKPSAHEVDSVQPPTETRVSVTQPSVAAQTFLSLPLSLLTHLFANHVYVIQAKVLYESWALNESQQAFVQKLQEEEKNKLRVTAPAFTPAPPEPQKTETPKPKAKGKSKIQESVKNETIDLSMANWTLRLVTDKEENMKVTKDTERRDEIKSLKKAWETAEPGRAAKALQCRLKFLEQFRKREDTENTESPVTAASEANKKEAKPLQYVPMDYTPFIRKEKEEPTLYTSEIEELEMRERMEKIQSYRLVRENVLERRKEQEINTENLKKHQQDMFETMQAKLWASRRKLLEVDACNVRQKGDKEEQDKQAVEDEQDATKQPLKPAKPAKKK
uniref:Androglobin n=1 Tax=Knipowitschia caucasica TaxID=637954 RepID=A0AAV2KG87_KNICA